MRFDRQRLARTAMAKALQLRKRTGASLWEAVCVYDIAERLGVDVRFIDIPSMEGAYCLSGRANIIVSSLRPPGRQVFTAAHELGHHVFGHGDQYDDLVHGRQDDEHSEPNEFMADCFAGALLMPKLAIDHSFAVRAISPHNCKPEDVYAISTYLGVGYQTLISHMRFGLRMLSSSRAEDLLGHTPQLLRSRLLGRECRGNLIMVDQNWTGRAIDLQVAELILLPACTSVEGRAIAVTEQTSTATMVQAIQPGIGRVVSSGGEWAAYVRVMRKEYCGLGKYRFEEEVNDDVE